MGRGSSEDDWSSDGSSRSWSRSPAAQSPDGGKGKKKKRHGGHKSSGKKSKKNNKKREAPAKWTSSEESESDYGRRSRSPFSDDGRGHSGYHGRRGRRYSPSPTRGPPRPRNHQDHQLDVTFDAREDKMRLRKRAMVMGKFRFIIPEDGTEFETTTAFRSTVARHGRSNRAVHYSVKPIGFRKAPRAQHSNTRYAILKADFPGIGDRFHVAWATPLGDVHVDGMVKLYDLRSIQMHCIDYDSRGPKSGWFGLVDPRIADTPDSKVHFDANIFWTVGLLYKHYGTCGVEDWDIEIAEMANTHVLAENTNRLSSGHPSASLVQHAPAVSHTIPSLMSVQTVTPAAPPPAQHAAPSAAALDPSQLISCGGSAASMSATTATTTSSVTLNANLAAMGVRTSTVNNAASGSQTEATRFTGCVVDWRGTYGFVSCHHLPRKVFLHHSVIEGWDPEKEMPLGSSLKFTVEYDPVRSSYKALEAQLFA